MQQRRPIESFTPQVRNVPMRPRAWRALLETDGAVVAERPAGQLALVPEDGQLHCYWAFSTLEDMRLVFTEMWDEVRPAIAASDIDHVVLDFVSVQNRDWLEPMLRDADFAFFAEWMEMVHPEIDPNAIPEFPEGAEMRRAQGDDLDAVRRLWAEAYGELSDGDRTIEARLESASWVGLLTADGEPAAFAVNGDVEEANGRILGAGVAPDFRGRGYGALVVAAAMYQLTTQDARRATIEVRPDIPQGLRLCRDLGFSPDRAGLEYRRSTDEAAIQQQREERRVAGVKARFGKWR